MEDQLKALTAEIAELREQFSVMIAIIQRLPASVDYLVQGERERQYIANAKFRRRINKLRKKKKVS